MDPQSYINLTDVTLPLLKRKASQELPRDGTEEVEDGGEGRRGGSSVTEIDPHGDLQMNFVIRANENEFRGFLVNKHTLCLSSPVFRAMLADDSPFRKTTNQDGSQVVQLEDDDIAAMEIIMNAIHHNNHKVPMLVTITQFEELAILCDKYDIRCLRPWAEIWSKQYLDQDYSSLPRPLFIASVFKLADWFVHLTKDLILKTTLSSERGLLLELSSDFREGMPRSILDKIATRQTDLIAQLLQLVWTRSFKLRYNHDIHRACQMDSEPEHEQRMCDLINLGTLTRHFPNLFRSPHEDVEQLTLISALDVLSSISRLIPVSDTPLPDNHFTMIHKNCCVGRILSTKANKIIESVDGIELEGEGAEAQPPQPPQALSEMVERKNLTHGSPQLKVVMRLTAIPNDTNFWQDVAVPSQAGLDMGFAWCPKVICIHCSAFEYSLFQHRHLGVEHETNLALLRHLCNGVHWHKVPVR